MWRPKIRIFVPAFASVVCLVLISADPAIAQCTLPYQLTNGQTADATQVMADFNALITCLNNVAPGGSANSIQYNQGNGTLGGVGPLNNGQIPIGSAGSPPQAGTLTAGSGIAIANGPGSITISSTVGGNGLYGQILSATPTSTSTGLTNWLNQGSASFVNSLVGLSVTAPTSGSNPDIAALYMAAPTPPYTITALVGATRNSNNYSAIGIGWYDGTSKLHLNSYSINGGGSPYLVVNKWNSVTSYNSSDVTSSTNAFAQPIWLRIADDGTNVSFSFSQDGANFLQLFSVAKASGFLGASGYSNVVFFVNPQGGQTIGTLLSWMRS